MHLYQLTVIGIGAKGEASLSPDTLKLLQLATVIAGSRSHLSHLSNTSARKIPLDPPIETWISTLQQELTQGSLVLLASGDPLFFGIGRLLLQTIPSEQLSFYPHVSSIQLAFSRAKLPWQNARIISVHGRSLDQLEQALKQAADLMAVLTDPYHTPAVIAQLILDLKLPSCYRIWIGSRLGSDHEMVQCLTPTETQQQTFEDPNVVLLERIPAEPDPTQWPLLGIPDDQFWTFPDQPGLITKQEIRTLTLALLQLSPQNKIIWDIGAGTGSVSIEIARLLPTAQIYAVEKQSLGVQLIQQNCQRFQINTIEVIPGSAPDMLDRLPDPERVLLGGGGAQIPAILEVVAPRLQPKGVIVGNFATLEACLQMQLNLKQRGWMVKMLQVQLARSTQIVDSTRFSPLNPVILVQAVKPR